MTDPLDFQEFLVLKEELEQLVAHLSPGQIPNARLAYMSLLFPAQFLDLFLKVDPDPTVVARIDDLINERAGEILRFEDPKAIHDYLEFLASPRTANPRIGAVYMALPEAQNYRQPLEGPGWDSFKESLTKAVGQVYGDNPSSAPEIIADMLMMIMLRAKYRDALEQAMTRRRQNKAKQV